MGLASYGLHTSPDSAAGEICGSAGLPMPQKQAGCKPGMESTWLYQVTNATTLLQKTHLRPGQGKVMKWAQITMESEGLKTHADHRQQCTLH